MTSEYWATKTFLKTHQALRHGLFDRFNGAIIRSLLGVVATTVLVIAAPVAAIAASSPLAGYTLEYWLYMGPPQFPQPHIEFVYQGGAVQEPFTLPIYNETGTPGGTSQSQWFAAYSQLGQTWGGRDNPAPLLWYAKNVNPTWLGQAMMPVGLKYTSQLVATMTAENFSPSLVGGTNPSSMSTPSPTPTSSSSPSTTAGTTGGSTAASGSGATQPSSSGESGTSSTGPTSGPSSTPPPTPTSNANTGVPSTGSAPTPPSQPGGPQSGSQGTSQSNTTDPSHHNKVALGNTRKASKADSLLLILGIAIMAIISGTVLLLRRNKLDLR